MRSYLAAQSKIKQVFGPELVSKATAVANQAGDLTSEYAPYVSTIESVLNK